MLAFYRPIHTPLFTFGQQCISTQAHQSGEPMCFSLAGLHRSMQDLACAMQVWTAHVHTKRLLFAAIAQQRNGEVQMADDECGNALACLQVQQLLPHCALPFPCLPGPALPGPPLPRFHLPCPPLPCGTLSCPLLCCPALPFLALRCPPPFALICHGIYLVAMCLACCAAGNNKIRPGQDMQNRACP